MVPSLFTIGYSGFTLEAFAARLIDAGVKVLVDVREKPLSRKKGFSKSALSEFLESRGIEYRHVKALGVPAPLRAELKNGGCFHRYLAAFDDHLSNCSEAILDLYALAQEKACCLMCVEKSSEECHRSIVVKALARRQGPALNVEHL